MNPIKRVAKELSDFKSENNNTIIPSYSLHDIEQKYDLKFNVLIADCDGFLELFFDENPYFYDNLRLIIFEEDYPEKCNYEKIKNTLRSKQFNNVYNLGQQTVWIRGEGQEPIPILKLDENIINIYNLNI